MFKLSAVLLALALAIVPTSARAWGAEGHRLIARIAYERLTPAARAEVNRLIATDAADPSPGCAIDSVDTLSTWSDCVRSIRAYSNQSGWHYDNIPVCESAPPFDCPNGNCATRAIERAERVLANTRSTDQQRVRALARLVHFIGDIHQPLHASDNGDRGGNDVRVIFEGQATYRTQDGASRSNTLHGIWDTPLLRATQGLGDTAGPAIEMDIAAHAGAYAQEDARAWTAESNRIAVEFIYARWPEPLRCGAPPTLPVNIDQRYINEARPIIREQLAKASVRLAMVLNRTLR
jgi:hypothetical protein